MLRPDLQVYNIIIIRYTLTISWLAELTKREGKCVCMVGVSRSGQSCEVSLILHFISSVINNDNLLVISIEKYVAIIF